MYPLETAYQPPNGKEPSTPTTSPLPHRQENATATPAQLGLLIGCCAAAIFVAVRFAAGSTTSDFVEIWHGARAPVCHDASLPCGFGFVGFGAGFFAYAVCRAHPTGPQRLALCSGAFVSAVTLVSDPGRESPSGYVRQPGQNKVLDQDSHFSAARVLMLDLQNVSKGFLASCKGVGCLR